MTDELKHNPDADSFDAVEGSEHHEPSSRPQPLNVFGPIDEPMEDLVQGDALPKDTEEMALDDFRRVKVLSPGMLVFKRFIRNKLAVVGIIILAIMFVFSFLGPIFSPYTQTQTFKGMKPMSREFAGAIYNTEERYTVAEGESFGPADRAAYLLARGQGVVDFKAGDTEFYYIEVIPDFYRIVKLEKVAQTNPLGELPENDPNISEEFIAAYEANKNQGSFVFEDVKYIITGRKVKSVSTEKEVAIASIYVFDPYKQTDNAFVKSHAFMLGVGKAIADGSSSFTVENREFNLEMDGNNGTVKDLKGENFAQISNIIVNPLNASTFLDIDFKEIVRDTMNDKKNDFYHTDEQGNENHYKIVVVNQNYNILRDMPTEVIRTYEAPNDAHWLGLDNNGMDLLTRLMYGGRISLMVGFVVIIIEMLIGVIFGGISGYFGGAVDTIMMRFVDLFNSIPFYPIVIIFGSVMDALQVGSTQRIFLLMGILGVLGWTGIARVVRGQILSLREQDFMIATEATGIKTSRRIFRHLIPNVMPLLIVSATAGLGGIIISEATLGFLGLGIKYPEASWGSIINVASDAHVMQSYWWMWFPAGMLILLTVLGFNFVGDGLRDAYDPKMKR